VILFYTITLIPFYIFFKEKSKARIVLNYIFRKIFKKDKEEIKTYEKTSILAWFVK
jgi:hypothetical protein